MELTLTNYGNSLTNVHNSLKSFFKQCCVRTNRGYNPSPSPPKLSKPGHDRQDHLRTFLRLMPTRSNRASSDPTYNVPAHRPFLQILFMIVHLHDCHLVEPLRHNKNEQQC